jgi:NADPH:quinone reductase-like Zn-dependent oxidoreductase
MNYLTAQFALVVRQRLTEGQWVLVHGAAGGLGTALVQLVRALGARVIAVVSSAAKAEVARAAGAHHVVGVDDFQARIAAGRSPARWCLALPERCKSIAATLTAAKASPGRSLGRDVITR